MNNAESKAVIQVDGTILFENARLIWKNFAGIKRLYNEEGNRNFSVVLENEELIEDLIKLGWNVKQKAARSDDEEPLIHLPIAVAFDSRRPPAIYLINSKGRRQIGEELAVLIDNADADNWDLIVRPYDWEVNGKRGKKAYLKELFVTLHESVLDMKYADLPDISLGPDASDSEWLAQVWPGYSGNRPQ